MSTPILGSTPLLLLVWTGPALAGVGEHWERGLCSLPPQFRPEVFCD
jgi:hypothetical protein